MASVTEELNILFLLILINTNFSFTCHMWLVATILDIFRIRQSMSTGEAYIWQTGKDQNIRLEGLFREPSGNPPTHCPENCTPERKNIWSRVLEKYENPHGRFICYSFFPSFKFFFDILRPLVPDTCSMFPYQ